MGKGKEEGGWRAALARRPRLVAWAVLALGMVVILLFSARGVGLTAGQLAALVVMTIILGGLCVWIIGWE